ncbi:MAG: phosphoribosylformylglycinamidine cyclo-ligase [Verrucomicrobia bacterium]|nr:phosphoribosylformylglycinamidine cyclo-ligase [Verrucomicrobiota bacterium]
MAGKLTYKEAGVDTVKAAALVGEIKTHVQRTQKQRQLMGAFGLFAAAYELKGYREPVIVTGCDGVGTKLEVQLEHGRVEDAGKDLVAMSVNDILTTGGDPLMFLDYIGMAKLDDELITRLVAGMADYLEDCGCILAGGETAEMPGIVPPGVVELSGFAIGCVEKSEMVDPTSIAVGDVLVGYASDGPHANGWSLVRRVLADHAEDFSKEDVEALLAPTRLYHDVVQALREGKVTPKAFAHITGGGLPENLERLFQGMGADLEIPVWEGEAVQKLLRHVDEESRFHTFNMGIGWVVVVSPEQAGAACAAGPGGTILGVVGRTEGVRVKVKCD